MSRVFVVVSEARADFDLATELADRVLVESIDWLEGYLESNRKWIGNDLDDAGLTWSSVATRAREQRIKAHGQFDGKRGEADARAARRAIIYLHKNFPDANAILLIRDQDNQPERRAGLQQARDASNHIKIVIGVAVIERESWVLSGFLPESDAETKKLRSEMESLAFHPCDCAHRLTAKLDHQDLSPKRILKVLTDDNLERQRKCWVETPLASLRSRGQDNGLAEYLNEVSERLVPLVKSPKEL